MSDPFDDDETPATATGKSDPFADDGKVVYAEPGEPPPEVERDNHGRYLIPDPDSGKRRAWTRATTFVKAAADQYFIDLYHNRMVLKGTAMRPDVVAEAAATHIDDKKTLNGLAEVAMEAAGASAKARLGTALHAYTEKLDRGEKFTAPEPWDKDVEAYVDLKRRRQIKVDPNYIETTVIVPSLGVAGTLDRLGHVADFAKDSPLKVLDLKTGHSIEYAWLEIVCQLYVYSRATHIYDHRTRELIEIPKIEQGYGYVMHLPVGKAQAFLYKLDLEFGGRVAAASSVVRDLRAHPSKTYVALVGEPTEPPGAKQPASRAKSDPERRPAIEMGRGPEDLRGNTEVAADRIPEAWLEAGINPKKPLDFQIGKIGDKRYILADLRTLDYEIYPRRKDCASRYDEVVDLKIDANADIRPLGITEEEYAASGGDKQARGADDDDWGDDDSNDGDDWGDDSDDGDDWDAEKAGPPPRPQTRKKAAKKTAAAAPIDEPPADDDDDDWGDDADSSDADEEAARVKADLAKVRESRDEEDRPSRGKRKWLEEIFGCETVEQLESLYREAKKVGEASDRFIRAAAKRKADILAADDDDDDDDDW